MARTAKEAPKTRTVRGVGDNGEDIQIDGKKMLGFVEHLEKIDKKKDQILQENREVYADAKAVGYSGKIIRKILRKRKDGEEKAKEEAELLMIYERAIGMADDE